MYVCFFVLLSFVEKMLYCLIHSKTGTTDFWTCLYSLPIITDIHFGASMTLTRLYLGSFIFAFNVGFVTQPLRGFAEAVRHGQPWKVLHLVQENCWLHCFLFLLDVSRMPNAICKQKKATCALMEWLDSNSFLILQTALRLESTVELIPCKPWSLRPSAGDFRWASPLSHRSLTLWTAWSMMLLLVQNGSPYIIQASTAGVALGISPVSPEVTNSIHGNPEPNCSFLCCFFEISHQTSIIWSTDSHLWHVRFIIHVPSRPLTLLCIWAGCSGRSSIPT